MSHSKNLVVIFLVCAAFVSIAAVLRASGSINSAFTAASADAFDTNDGSGEGKGLVTDEEFFKPPTRVSAFEQAARILPRTEKPVAPADPITAESYIVGDVSTGKIYLEKNSSKVMPFASMSKIVTAIVAADKYAPTDVVEIATSSTEVAPDTSMLYAGEKFTVKELLEPMLISSSNIAAEAISSAAGERIAFLEAMSSYAWEIGMSDSYFADPSGLSPRNAGTAKGFFALARYLYEEKPEILAITRTAQTSMATTTEHGAHVIESTHPFVNDPRFMGGKTGRTPEALETMLTIMSIKDTPIAVIVLRSSWARAEDTRLLFEKVERLIE